MWSFVITLCVLFNDSYDTLNCYYEAYKEEVAYLFKLAHLNPAQKIFIRLEVISVDESCYWLNKPEEYVDDFIRLTKRYNTVRNYPKIECVMLFNSNKYVAKESREFNKEYQGYLERMMYLYPQRSEYYREILLETERLYVIYDRLENIYLTHMGMESRRENLQELLRILGPENFRQGRLPPHVPFEYFVEVR